MEASYRLVLLLLCQIWTSTGQLSKSQLIPFGAGNGDTIFFANDDDTTNISIPVRFPFYDRLYQRVYINNNGLLSFEAPVTAFTPVDFPFLARVRGIGGAFIAPFWADVHTTEDGAGGAVYFRRTTETATLNQIEGIIQGSQSGKGLCFRPTWALVVTWEDVGYFNQHNDKTNTFQVVLATDGTFSYTIFQYVKLEWTAGDASGGTEGLGGTPAMVGINAGDGVRFKKHKYGFTNDVLRVAEESNMDGCLPAGRYVYQIDTEVLVGEESCVDTTSTPVLPNVCKTGKLGLTPSFGTIHSGGYITATGYSSTELHDIQSNSRDVFVKFGVNSVKYKCAYVVRTMMTVIIICPIPLFSPDDVGMKTVTLLIDTCTTGLTGQFRVDPPALLIDGNIQFKMVDCNQPHNNPVFGINSLFCITWDPNLFQLKGCSTTASGSSAATGIATLYILGDTSLVTVDASPWKIIRLKGKFINQHPSISAGQLKIDFTTLVPKDRNETQNPKDVLMFIQLSATVEGITIFYGTPLVSYVPKVFSSNLGGSVGVTAQTSMQTLTNQCESVKSILTAHNVSSLPPCPRNSDQAFLDPSFEVDQGCSRKDPNPPFNCHFHPKASECFLQKVNDSIVGQCCYDNNGLYIQAKPGKGFMKRRDPLKDFKGHFTSDLWPIFVCCSQLQTPDSLCERILEHYEGASTQNYVPVRPVFFGGDPHFRTLDGKAYTFNGLGEYTLVNASSLEFAVQIRTALAPSSETVNTAATVISAIAVQQGGGDRLQVEYNERFGVTNYINGEKQLFTGESRQNFDGFTVFHSGITSNYTFSTGVTISVTGKDDVLNVGLGFSERFKGETVGLLGTWNDNPDDDLQARNGTILPADATEEEIFYQFGQTWLTKDGVSLFYYRGLGRESFTDESFVPQFGLPDSITEEEKMKLEEMCHGNTECIYDIAVTGNMDIGISTMLNGEVFETREAGSLPVICDPPCQNGGECVQNDTCSCILEYTGPTCESDMFVRTSDKLSQTTVLTAPLLLDDLSSETLGMKKMPLCYQVQGKSGKTFALVSDICLAINVEYKRQRGSTMRTLINRVGIIGIDDNSSCINLEVSASSCTVKLGGQPLMNNYNESGLVITLLSNGVTVHLPNCEFRSAEITVICNRFRYTNQEKLELILSRMFNFQPTSHGLLGQFWNVPVTLSNTGNTIDVGSVKDLPVYKVKIARAGGPTQIFTGFQYPYTWDLDDETCLYAGKGQARGVIEGNLQGYQVGGIFATDFAYTQFRGTCIV